MSVERGYGKEEIVINELNSIVLEEKSDDGYEWKEVTFKYSDEEIYIGSYYTYNYTCTSEWMEFNENYIALLVIYKGGHENSDTQVKKLFDINSKQVIEGTQEELLSIYNQEFKKVSKKKTLTQK